MLHHLPFPCFLHSQVVEVLLILHQLTTRNRNPLLADAGSTDELNEKLNDLYQQENQLFADHKEAWDKAFGFMSKNTSGDSMTENYADSLASAVDSNKDSFSEEEYDTLSKDIETIRGIEKEIAKLEKQARAEKQHKKKFELVLKVRSLKQEMDLLSVN